MKTLIITISIALLCTFDAYAQRNPIKPIQNVLDKIKRANNVRKGTTKSVKTIKKLVEDNKKEEYSNKSHHRSCITNEAKVAYGAEYANNILRQESKSVDMSADVNKCLPYFDKDKRPNAYSLLEQIQSFETKSIDSNLFPKIDIKDHTPILNSSRTI